MPIPPLLHPFVQVDQVLRHDGRPGVVAVDPQQNFLERRRGFEWLGDIAPGRDVVPLHREVGDEGVEERRPCHRVRDLGTLVTAFGVMREHPLVPAAEDGLQNTELGRLEPARSVESRTETGELARSHRLEHIDLRDHHLEDSQDSPQSADGVSGVTRFELLLQVKRLVENLFEPKFIHLVDHDEEQFVVLVGSRMLSVQQFVQRKVGCVTQCGLSVVHFSVTSSKWRCAAGASA